MYVLKFTKEDDVAVFTYQRLEDALSYIKEMLLDGYSVDVHKG